MLVKQKEVEIISWEINSTFWNGQFSEITRRPNTFMPEEWIRRNETEIDLFIPAEIISAEIFFAAIKKVKPSE